MTVCDSGENTEVPKDALSPSGVRTRIFMNAATDTGVLFEVGNSVIGYSVSAEAGTISLSVAALCASARAVNEARQSGLAWAQTENWAGSGLGFNKMVDNPGVGMVISGSGLLASSAFAAAEGLDLTSLGSFYGSGQEMLILGSFGLANGLRGLARGYETGSASQTALDTTAISLAAAGAIMAGPVPDIGAITDFQTMAVTDAGIKTLFAVAAAKAIYLAGRGMKESGWLRPDYLFSAGYMGNAALSAADGNTPMACANALFAFAFVTLDALKSAGGFHQRFYNRPPRLPVRETEDQKPEIS